MAYTIGEKCVGCTLCARLCPVGAISGEKKQRHVVKETRCVECGVCGRGCPSGAIAGPEKVPAMKRERKYWPQPVFHQNLCSACSMCVAACSFGCISIQSPRFQGDIHVTAQLENPKACVGCGLCAESCPLDAIIMVEGRR